MANRKNRSTRRNRKNQQWGGDSSPAPVTGDSMASMTKMNMAQGEQFANMHKAQHGGALEGASYPNSDGPLLKDASLVASSRVLPLNQAHQEILGLKDQAGGRRHRSSRKSRKGRKGRKTRQRGGACDGVVSIANAYKRKNCSWERTSNGKARLMTKVMAQNNNNLLHVSGGKSRRRRQRGGSYSLANAGSTSGSAMLLSGSMASKALGGMHDEWRLATNPKAFAPGV